MGHTLRIFKDLLVSTSPSDIIIGGFGLFVYSNLYRLHKSFEALQGKRDTFERAIIIDGFLSFSHIVIFESFCEQSVHFTRDIIVGRPYVVSH